MKFLSILLTAICLLLTVSAQTKDYTKYVNPFIGTGGHGHTFPGATMPFGMVQLSPDTRIDNWDGFKRLSLFRQRNFRLFAHAFERHGNSRLLRYFADADDWRG